MDYYGVAYKLDFDVFTLLKRIVVNVASEVFF